MVAEAVGKAAAKPAPPRYAELDRAPLRWVELDLEHLIGADHPARAIWDWVGGLDLTPFEAGYASRQGSAGRPGWAPRVLIRIWIYASSQGIASARAVERRMGWEPGLRWLAADEVINHHTLSDFRVSEQERLQGLFTQVLGVMQSEERVDLQTVLQDGTKVRARAGKASLHRRKTFEEHCAEARAVVVELERQGEQEAADARRQAARQRAARERVERRSAAREEMKRREQEADPARRAELRVSESEPEARKMKHAEGSWAPSYHVQVQTEARSRMVVGIAVTQAASDVEQLVGGLEQVQKNTGAKPARRVADGGYASRENVEPMSQRGVELIAPWKESDSRSAGACKRQGMAEEFRPGVFTHDALSDTLRCPRGRSLALVQIHKHPGVDGKV